MPTNMKKQRLIVPPRLEGWREGERVFIDQPDVAVAAIHALDPLTLRYLCGTRVESGDGKTLLKIYYDRSLGFVNGQWGRSSVKTDVYGLYEPDTHRRVGDLTFSRFYRSGRDTCRIDTITLNGIVVYPRP